MQATRLPGLQEDKKDRERQEDKKTERGKKTKRQRKTKRQEIQKEIKDERNEKLSTQRDRFVQAKMFICQH